MNYEIVMLNKNQISYTIFIRIIQLENEEKNIFY